MRRDVFQAIADPNRRSIIFILAVRSMTPNEIASYFSISRQAVSKHLQILMDCDIVQANPQGRLIYYHLLKEKMSEIHVWLENLHSLIDQKNLNIEQALALSKPQPPEINPLEITINSH